MDLSKRSLTRLTITIIRVAIGWHFFYEGLTKLLMGGWTSQPYLANATGFLSGFYHWLAGLEGLVGVIDIMNVYGLILIGLALFTGLFVRLASVGGIMLLLLYYFAYPPWGSSLFGSSDGHFYIVNRNFIEAFLLLWFGSSLYGQGRFKPGTYIEAGTGVNLSYFDIGGGSPGATFQGIRSTL